MPVSRSKYGDLCELFCNVHSAGFVTVLCSPPPAPPPPPSKAHITQSSLSPYPGPHLCWPPKWPLRRTKPLTTKLSKHPSFPQT